ncbi:DNA polymerase III epsilon subunit-like 3'-5' exonuclease [Beggiatoa alba B18LD]|uniref:DNA polymerase III epsilon subunit-like 3'-5' exonuclease n=1 Tax=Beggiatoa alba B18LD TaxID=395493 RepID=I3CEI5_9GAMM|nr:3'-5' exonuclease [Beggiatoa alba]EIJ42028.1 DNA polymerase III epsilon subunit-like 3'-5' exonuclease [Beggiatoa alba B18LD]
MMHDVNFLVIDTEGKSTLNEIAILNADGKLIYEAFNQDTQQEIQFNNKPLKTILQDILQLSVDKTLVFHYAEHDIRLLKRSFKSASLTFPPLKTACTFLMAKQALPQATSYSLAYLSKYLGLKVDHQFFNQNAAHSARYDAAFTHQLYCHLTQTANFSIKPQIMNPFSDSRVDNPFQQHLDLKSVYQHEFATLKSILNEIKQDPNHQSKGAVVIGEAGSGKTHLMMRLAQEVLKNNRLLFIRQPNNPDAILHHVYSRILESFIEKVPDTPFSQLEYLLAHSFSKIAIEHYQQKQTKKDEPILDALTTDHLNIYAKLGAEGTEIKRNNWASLERMTRRWWESRYSFAGIATAIIQGLIKYCAYRDPHRRDLVKRWLAGASLETEELQLVGLPDWEEELNLEDFSLQAMIVFGRLSLIDEPLIIVFDQLEGLKDNETLLTQFGNGLKEIFTAVPNSLIILNLFPDRWMTFQTIFDSSIVDRISQYRITLNRPDTEILKEILYLKASTQGVDLEKLFNDNDFREILSFYSIRTVLNRAAEYFRYRAEGISLPHLDTDKLVFEAQIWHVIGELKKEIQQLKQQIGITEPTPPASSQNNPAETANTPATVEQTLLDYLARIEQQLIADYSKKQIITEHDDVGKLQTIMRAFQSVKYADIELDCLHYGKKRLPDNLQIKTKKNTFVVGFLYLVGNSFTARLKNFNELVLQHKNYRFRICRDSREPAIKGKVGMDEIEKLMNAQNGNYYVMEQDDRIRYELLYQLIIDIQNKDLEVDLQQALNFVEMEYLRDFWIMALLRH